MAPILIDSRELVKLGFISLLISLAIFVAGFFSGFQQATTFFASGSETESLLLPKKVVAAESAIEPQSPAIIEAGEDVDVDHPGNQPEVIISAAPVSHSIEPLSARETGPDMVHEKPAGNETIAEENAQLGVEEDTSGTAEANNISSGSTVVTASTAIPAVLQPDIKTLTAAEIANIKFSVQVGMFGRLSNAENMMRVLQAQQLDAYVSDYSNKKKEVRYNVRFGYFTDKKSAVSALKAYKNKQKGDGYLVKFSMENITDLAKADDTVQPAVQQPELLQRKEQNNTSDSILPDAMTLQSNHEPASAITL